MFAPLSRFRHRRPDAVDLERPFVRELHVDHPREARSPRLERLLVLGWILVILKSAGVWWACRTYTVPFDPWWLIGPTLAFALLCTVLYWRRD